MLFKDFFVRHRFAPPGHSTKIVRIMKITAVLMLFACLQVSASGFSQTVTLSLRNTPLQKAIEQIKKQTGVSFILEEQLLEKTKPVTVQVTDASLKEVMDICFSGQPLTYELVDNIIVVKEKKMASTAVAVPPHTITGIVLQAATKEPIVGASIQVKGTKRGTVTDQLGAFSITSETGETLVISSMGFASKEYTVRSGNRVIISLEITPSSIKDVVVTGMFTRKAATATGSVSTFTQQDLLRAGNTNVVQSLKNLEPAFFVTENNLVGSNPNALPDIQVRGQTGLPDVRGEYSTNPNNPLFILDGIPVSLQTIIDLDMSRIKSATLLLDAASKAIYGSRAANGVMVIETVPPKSGKLLLSYSSNIKLSAPDLSSYNLTNAREKLELEQAAGLYNSVTGQNQYNLKLKYDEYLSNVQAGINTDWIAKPVRNGIGQQHSLTLEGGESPGMRYQATFRYYRVVGVMKGSDRNTLTGTLRLAYRLRNFNFTNTLTINDNKANNSPWGSFSEYVLMNPYLPYTDDNGRILKVITGRTRQIGVAGTTGGAPNGTPINENVYNPAYNATLNIKDQRTYTQLINNFNIDWALSSEFRLNATMGLQKQLEQGDVFLPADHIIFTSSDYNGDNAYRRGRYTRSTANTLNYNGNLVLTYIKSIGKSVITANLPLGIYQTRANSLSFAVEGFPNDRLANPALALQYYIAQGNRPIGTENFVRRLEGSVTANYSYDERFLFDFTAGKSKGTDAGIQAPWSNNWSVGAGWNIHNEAWIKSLRVVDLLRFTANTGFVGAEGYNSFNTLPTYNYILNNAYATLGNGALLTTLANPLLRPQRSQEHNIEGRLGLFRKLSFIFRYYIRNTDGLVSDITAPPSNGFATYKANLGQAQNKGFNANANVMLFADAKTRTSMNIFGAVAHNTNKLMKVSNQFKDFNTKQDAEVKRSPRTRFVDGQSLSTIWAVRSLGIDPSTGREVYLKADGTQTYVWSAADQVAAGDALPKFNGNFGFRLAIKALEVSTIMNYQLGGQQYNATLVDRVENADVYKNVDRRVFTGRWRKPGDVSYFKNIADFGITQASTRFVEDRNTLSLASLDLGYDLVQSISRLKNIGFSRLRVGFNTTEVFQLSSIRVERGTDYPFARDFTFTLNASF